MRGHPDGSADTSAAKMAPMQKTALIAPTSASEAAPPGAIVAPLTRPCNRPVAMASAATPASRSRAFSATSAPAIANDSVVSSGSVPADGQRAPTMPPTSHASGSANSA